MSKSFYQLQLEAGEPGNAQGMDDAWDKIRNSIDGFIGKVNAYLSSTSATPEQKQQLYTNIVNHMMKSGGFGLDVPGLGRVSNIGIGARNYNRENKLHPQHIRYQYQNLLKKGMSHEQAVEQLKKMWNGVDDRTLNSVLRTVKIKEPVPEKPVVEKPQSPTEPEHFDRLKGKYIEFLKNAGGNRQMARNELAKLIGQEFPYFMKMTPKGNLSPTKQDTLKAVVDDIAGAIEGGRGPQVWEDLPPEMQKMHPPLSRQSKQNIA